MITKRDSKGRFILGGISPNKGKFGEESSSWGNKHSKETKIKIGLSHKGRRHSSESIVKMQNRKKKENHPRWKGIWKHSSGYIYVYSPEHPNKNLRDSVLQHRLVMEKKLGRYLEPQELVHHRNGIKNDNREENLQIVFLKTHYGEVRCPHCLNSFAIK
jgi:hypothetical protein